jgi:hypothetical protein
MAGDCFFLCVAISFTADFATHFVITVGYYPYYYVIQRYATIFSNSVYFMTHLTRPKIFIMVLFAVLPVPASFNFSYRIKLFFSVFMFCSWTY